MEKKKPLVVSAGASDRKGLQEDVQKLFRCKDDGKIVVLSWITDVPYDPLKGTAKVCREDGFEDEDIPQWTKKVIGTCRDQVLEDVEARNVYPANIMWKSTDFLRHVTGETEERGAITFTHVCEHCKLFPEEDFWWWVSTDHGERRKKQYERLVVRSVRTTV